MRLWCPVEGTTFVLSIAYNSPMSSYVLLFVVVVLPFGGCFQFIDCGSQMGHFKEITVTDCDPPNMAYCKLSRGHNFTLTVNFIPSSDLSTVTAVVHGILGIIPIPFNIPNPDGCKDSGLQCPLKANKSYIYVATLPILLSYPKVKVIVKWELQSKDKEDIICFELPVKIS